MGNKGPGPPSKRKPTSRPNGDRPKPARPKLTPQVASSPTRGQPEAVKPTDVHAPRNRFPVVGVGASAGGLEALSQLLRNLPSDTGMAFVLVQHLSAPLADYLTDWPATGGSAFERLQLALRRIPHGLQELNMMVRAKAEGQDLVRVG